MLEAMAGVDMLVIRMGVREQDSVVLGAQVPVDLAREAIEVETVAEVDLQEVVAVPVLEDVLEEVPTKPSGLWDL